MSAAVTRRCRVTLAEAQAILATEPEGTERWAMANTIVSLSAAIEMLADDGSFAGATTRGIDLCPGCGRPCHATEGNEDGYHPECMPDCGARS